jgi:hypothetical protein
MSNKLGDMLKEMRDPNLSPQREEEIVRILNELDARNEVVKSWIKVDGSVSFKTLRAHDTILELSPARSVVFTGGSPASIPDNTYQDISFSDTRGLIQNVSPATYGCVKKVPGYDERFMQQDWVQEDYPVLFFGDFTFEQNATGSREVNIEFFDKDAVSSGNYSFGVRAAASDWTSISFNFMDSFYTGGFVKFEVWQDSGIALALYSANFGFMLG